MPGPHHVPHSDIKDVRVMVNSTILDVTDLVGSTIFEMILAYEEVRQGIELFARSGTITDQSLNGTVTVCELTSRLDTCRTPFRRRNWPLFVNN